MKSSTTYTQKITLTPLSFSSKSVASLSGSAHNKSHKRPLSGISVGLGIFSILCIFFNSGDKPPCIHNIFSSIRAATGKKLNNSVNEIVMNLPEHDSTFNIKLLYEKNILKKEDKFENN